jgi:hypothetical protein
MDLVRSIYADDKDSVAVSRDITPAYAVTTTMHVVVFVIGNALLIGAATTAIWGRTSLAALLAAFGTAAFVVGFIARPITDVTAAVANRVQLELVLTGLSRELSLWKAYATTSPDGGSPYDVDSVALSEMRRSTHRAIGLVESYCRSKVRAVPDVPTDEADHRESGISEPGISTSAGPLPPKFAMEKMAIMDKVPNDASAVAPLPPGADTPQSPPKLPIEKPEFEKSPTVDKAPVSDEKLPVPFALTFPHHAPGEEAPSDATGVVVAQLPAKLAAYELVLAAEQSDDSDAATQQLVVEHLSAVRDRLREAWQHTTGDDPSNRT